MIIFFIVLLLGFWCTQAQAKSFQTQQQALTSTFTSQHIERKTLFLNSEQVTRIEQLARAKIISRIVSYYVSCDAAGATRIAFFDRQIVRDMPVSFMVVVKPSGEIDRVEILSFEEPADYLPPLRWLQLYRSHVLNSDLMIGRLIPHITGASLTSQAMNDGIRRTLATFEVGVKSTL